MKTRLTLVTICALLACSCATVKEVHTPKTNASEKAVSVRSEDVPTVHVGDTLPNGQVVRWLPYLDTKETL